ncbi:stage II sporulation protein P [Paenibacillaceae bacterium]|nr:stage II sporulation protein P [Paenibacillaceae bacterium]
MRRWVAEFDRGSIGSRLRLWLATGRTFALLSVCSAAFFMVLGIGTMVHRQAATSPMSSMKGLASAVSGSLFAGMIGMEMPMFEGGKQNGSFSGVQTTSFLMHLLTDINPGDPRSLVAGELPGLNTERAVLLRSGSGTSTAGRPHDQQPLPINPDQIEQESEGTSLPDGTEEIGQTDPPEDDTPAVETTEDDPAKPTTGGRKMVFIYHSHPRESWYPEVDADDANSTKKNITLVGKRLSESLESLGIGATHSGTDYPTAIEKYRWELSYKYSMETVKQAMSQDTDLKFFFDLHRDSQRRKHTTATINGKDYAQVFFIIGHRNPDWERNELFATKIHEALERDYPGISRGIWGKTASTGNGEYNQSLSPDSVLIEVGGVDNTLEESYRTADALAKIISEIYWEAEKVDGSKIESRTSKAEKEKRGS